jgi:hypothetical protein
MPSSEKLETKDAAVTPEFRDDLTELVELKTKLAMQIVATAAKRKAKISVKDAFEVVQWSHENLEPKGQFTADEITSMVGATAGELKDLMTAYTTMCKEMHNFHQPGAQRIPTPEECATVVAAIKKAVEEAGAAQQ